MSERVVIFDLDKTLTIKDSYGQFLKAALRRWPLRLKRCWSLPFKAIMFGLGLRDNGWMKQEATRAVLAGLSRSELMLLVQEFVPNLLENASYHAGLETLKAHQARGDHCILASASPDLYLNLIGEKLGFDEVIATRLQWLDDHLTGDFDGPNVYGKEKAARVAAYLAAYPGWTTLVYSDHHADLPLFEMVDEGFAVHPTRRLEVEAVTMGLTVLRW